MSFVQNVNKLATEYEELERLSKLMTPEGMHALHNLAGADKDAIDVLVKDLQLGVNSNGARKLDINLLSNVDVSADAYGNIWYNSARVYLTNNYVIDISFVVQAEFTTTTPVDIKFRSYEACMTALYEGLEKHNEFYKAKGELEKCAVDFTLEVVDSVRAGHPRMLRVLDAANAPNNTNILAVQLFVDVDQSPGTPLHNEPTFTWATSTSGILALLPSLPKLIADMHVWQMIRAEKPLPSTDKGVLHNDGQGFLKWMNGDFVNILNTAVDIKANYYDQSIEPTDVAVGAMVEVTQGGEPHPIWGLPKGVDVPAGSVLFRVDDRWLILDDSNRVRATLDIMENSNPDLGQIGYDFQSNRLVIGLPGTIPGEYGWVDASPALSAVDLSGFLSSDPVAIGRGAEANKAASPKQISEHLKATYFPLSRLAELTRRTDFDALHAQVLAHHNEFTALHTQYDTEIPDALKNLASLLTGKLDTAQLDTKVKGYHYVTKDTADKTYLRIKEGGEVEDEVSVSTGKHFNQPTLPSSDNHVANKKYVDDEVDKTLSKADGGEIDKTTSIIKSNAWFRCANAPLNTTDLANKEYVDSKLPIILHFKGTSGGISVDGSLPNGWTATRQGPGKYRIDTGAPKEVIPIVCPVAANVLVWSVPSNRRIDVNTTDLTGTAVDAGFSLMVSL